MHKRIRSTPYDRIGSRGSGVTSERFDHNIDTNGNIDIKNTVLPKSDNRLKGNYFDFLVELIEKYSKSPKDLLMSIQFDKKFFELITDENRLKGKFRDFKFLCNVIKILALIMASDPDLLSIFLSKINETHFEMPIIYYLTNFNKHLLRDKDLHLKTFDNLVQFIHKFQIIQQRNSRTKVSMICIHLNQVLVICNKKEDIISQKTISLVKQITEEVNKASKNINIEDIRSESINQMIKPPDDFRSKPICPTVEDIHKSGKPFLRSNIIKGKYINVDHYLDVQFRLLREDLVRPIKEDINKIRIALKCGEKLRNIKEIKTYTDVHIGKRHLSVDGFVNDVTFDVSPLRRINWTFSKRLIFGSMLCLSSDNFETFCFATVAGKRNPEMLSKGKFEIQFEKESMTEELKKVLRQTSLIVVESQAYYEAYRHILSALQRFTEETFPLKEYLIDVSHEIKDLPHLSPTIEYDLTDLMIPLMKIDSEEFSQLNKDLTDNNSESIIENAKCFDETDVSKRMRLEKVKILDNNSWPEFNDCGFDKPQYEAYKAALTKQMVVIQGPPGTGKTYVGLRIVQTLVRNKNLWNSFNREMDSSPIVVICYTNHALDQFLEGMIPFVKKTNGMVRIGGRSQSQILEKYSLLNLKREMQSEKLIPLPLFKSISKCKQNLKELENQLTKLEEIMQKTNEELIGINELEDIVLDNTKYAISKAISYQFYQIRDYDKNLKIALYNWLCLELETNMNLQNIYESKTKKFVNNDKTFEGMETDEQEIKYIMDSRIIQIESYEWLLNKNNESVEKHKRPQNRFEKLLINTLKSKDMMSEYEVINVRNIRWLSLENRWRLYRYWKNNYCQEIERRIVSISNLYLESFQYFNRLKVEEDLCVLRDCEVIGLTTNGAAKCRTLLQQIDPYIVIVEEAAEVLESHIITALTKNTKHLILIGDHQQLQPNPAVYELAKKYNLETSLFERLINNGLPYYQLKVQHRMRPNISSLLVPHIYKELRDHESVEKYENIKGVTKNMFFINHTEIESTLDDNRSKLNKYESEFIVRLCRYLILQEYKATQITILTMYSAQLMKIKQLMRSDPELEEVRAAVLDNYQGEECDIILISFVRSNIEGEIGFLKVKNRVNVALSRAKMGLYCIGNFELFSEKSDIWKNILNDLKEQNAIGPALELICQNHEKTCLVSKGSDFSRVPEGGCEQTCNTRLDCGHVCPRTCHIYDKQHKELKCMKDCEKIICPLDHKIRCTQTCHYPEDCQLCSIIVTKTRPNCGHEIKVKCFGNPNDIYCIAKCEKSLKCGHKMKVDCSRDTNTVDCEVKCNKKLKCGHEMLVECYKDVNNDKFNVICKQICDKQLLCGHKCSQKCGDECSPEKCREFVSITGVCSHQISIHCSKQNDIDFQLNACMKPCNQILECGHKCQGNCNQCYQKRLHMICDRKCERTLICGHICQSSCGRNCSPCRQKCENECHHRKCQYMCGIACNPCRRPCEWKCSHNICGKICSQLCNRNICDKPCYKQIKSCGHQCIGICGEKCPTKCRICDKNEVKEIVFGDEDKPNARFIQLEDCSHIIEFNGLLKYFAQKHYNNEIKMKRCPKCETIIRKTKLLNSTVQQTLIDIELIKTRNFERDSRNRLNASELKNRINNFCADERPVFLSFKPSLKSLLKDLSTDISKSDLLLTENKFKIYLELIELVYHIWLARNQKLFNTDFFPNFKYLDIIGKRIDKFIYYINHSFVNNKQQINDCQLEINGFLITAEAMKQLNQMSFNEQQYQLIVEAFDRLYTFGPFSQQNITQFKSLVDKAVRLRGKLGFNQNKRNIALKVIDFSENCHWLKCPIGHIYCTDNSDGFRVLTCPQCAVRMQSSHYFHNHNYYDNYHYDYNNYRNDYYNNRNNYSVNKTERMNRSGKRSNDSPFDRNSNKRFKQYYN